jgi:hypothetical protein
VRDEFVEQLSQAGFPRQSHQVEASGVSGPSRPAAPTLSELIAACPKQIGNATFLLGSGQSGTRWTATYFDFRNNRIVDEDTLCQSGDTPEEAVAKLWLATQNKQQHRR